MFNWLFSSDSNKNNNKSKNINWFSLTSKPEQNDDEFINAVVNNLIDTENINLNLYRASNRKYFDVENYPIPKMVDSPIWFALNRESVDFYMRTYDRKTKNFEDEIIVNEYQLRPNYKILKIKDENKNGQMDQELMKIIVDHVVYKIRNDEDKIKNIINKIKEDGNFKYLTHDENTQNILNDESILNNILNTFKGIYSDKRTNMKLIDELLFQEIINEMIRLNLIERYHIVGFWNGFTMNASPDPTPQEIIIINNKMKECLIPIDKKRKIYNINNKNNENDERENKRKRQRGGKKNIKNIKNKSKKFIKFIKNKSKKIKNLKNIKNKYNKNKI